MLPSAQPSSCYTLRSFAWQLHARVACSEFLCHIRVWCILRLYTALRFSVRKRPIRNWSCRRRSFQSTGELLLCFDRSDNTFDHSLHNSSADFGHRRNTRRAGIQAHTTFEGNSDCAHWRSESTHHLRRSLCSVCFSLWALSAW